MWSNLVNSPGQGSFSGNVPTLSCHPLICLQIRKSPERQQAGPNNRAGSVGRLHQDHSGWFVLLSFIPYIGGLIVLVFMCLPGTRGPNRFGPDPKEMEADALTETFR